MQPTAAREATAVLDDVQTAPDVCSSGFQYMYEPEEGRREIDFAHPETQLKSATPAESRAQMLNTSVDDMGENHNGTFHAWHE